jgi:hypothetical protein
VRQATRATLIEFSGANTPQSVPQAEAAARASGAKTQKKKDQSSRYLRQQKQK